jgi:hypothetical protein
MRKPNLNNRWNYLSGVVSEAPPHPFWNFNCKALYYLVHHCVQGKGGVSNGMVRWAQEKATHNVSYEQYAGSTNSLSNQFVMNIARSGRCSLCLVITIHPLSVSLGPPLDSTKDDAEGSKLHRLKAVKHLQR